MHVRQEFKSIKLKDSPLCVIQSGNKDILLIYYNLIHFAKTFSDTCLKKSFKVSSLYTFPLLLPQIPKIHKLKSLHQIICYTEVHFLQWLNVDEKSLSSPEKRINWTE